MFSLLHNKCLTKKLEEKTVDSCSLYVFLFGFYTQQNVKFSPITQTGVMYMYTVHCTSVSDICRLQIADCRLQTGYK